MAEYILDFKVGWYINRKFGLQVPANGVHFVVSVVASFLSPFFRPYKMLYSFDREQSEVINFASP